MGSIESYTKKIAKVEKEIAVLEAKLALEKKREEVGEISKAGYKKAKDKTVLKERTLRGNMRRFQQLRMIKEKEIKEKKEKAVKKAADKAKKQADAAKEKAAKAKKRAAKKAKVGKAKADLAKAKK